MKVIIGTDLQGSSLKEEIQSFLLNQGFTVVDATKEPSSDFVESTSKVVDLVIEDNDNLGIIFDGYGAGSFMVATKYKGMVAAQVSDERSAYMTRVHNNSRVITIGSNIVGVALAKNIVSQFLQADYDGGRHQVRVDMLNKM